MVVSLKDVERMLEHCAEGYQISLKLHFRSIRFNSLTYPTLPKHDEIEAGHIKKMARALGIYACAVKFLNLH
jgi:hypothetical protein